MLSGTLSAQEADKVNINTASVSELTQLQKVGPKIAERIVEFRTANGPFKKPEDIMQVKGVGASIFELNKDRMIVEDPGKPADPKSDQDAQGTKQ
jgi:competence protein ComEA